MEDSPAIELIADPDPEPHSDIEPRPSIFASDLHQQLKAVQASPSALQAQYDEFISTLIAEFRQK